MKGKVSFSIIENRKTLKINVRYVKSQKPNGGFATICDVNLQSLLLFPQINCFLPPPTPYIDIILLGTLLFSDPHIKSQGQLDTHTDNQWRQNVNEAMLPSGYNLV